MGELTDQLFAGGPKLLELNEKQQELFQEQAMGLPYLRWNIEKLDDTLRQGVVQKCKGMEEDKGVFFLKEYERYILLINSSSSGPLSEDEFRTLLVWCGHGPAIVSEDWVQIFTDAVKKQRKFQEWVLEKKLKFAPENTFLQRVVDAAKVG